MVKMVNMIIYKCVLTISLSSLLQPLNLKMTDLHGKMWETC